jgi:prepilin-type N-terminal cleavage/methylation domain-containing protein
MRGGHFRGFTLIELILSVLILSFGLVAIIGAYISVNNGLNSIQNRLAAVEFLKEKYALLRQKAIEEGGFKPFDLKEEVVLNGRPAVYGLQISSLSSSDNPDLSRDLNSAGLSLSWKEHGVDKKISISTYIENQR